MAALSSLRRFIANLPASLIAEKVRAEQPAFAYSHATGAVWRGTIHNASYGAAPLGKIDFNISPWRLLGLTLKLDLGVSGGAVDGAGTFAKSVRGAYVQDVSADVQLAPFANKGVLGEPVTGIARINIGALSVRGNRCVEAEGDVWTNVLNSPARKLRGGAFPLQGPITCADEKIVLVLNGVSEDGKAELRLSVEPNGAYQLSALAAPAKNDIASALVVFRV